MKHLYNTITAVISKNITRYYTTSFSIAIQLLDTRYRQYVYDIYAFVRVADEIVDDFFGYDQRQLLEQYIEDTYRSIDNHISTNPVLHRFQYVVNMFSIDKEIIEQFFYSMKLDLDVKVHEKKSYDTYVHGSAEVVGLMCLKVLANDNDVYLKLKKDAQVLGSVLQKVNFLRDIHADYYHLHRSYFPSIDMSTFDDVAKQTIEREIQEEFDLIKGAISHLDKTFKYAIYAIYKYYFALYKKIKRTPANILLKKRVRVNNMYKLIIYAHIKILQFFHV